MRRPELTCDAVAAKIRAIVADVIADQHLCCSPNGIRTRAATLRGQSFWCSEADAVGHRPTVSVENASVPWSLLTIC